MHKNAKIQRQDCHVRKHIMDSETRQSSLDSCTTVKSSIVTEGIASNASYNSSGSNSNSHKTNSTNNTNNTTGSSSASSEVEAKERRFGSINLHPLPDTHQSSECFHGNFRYKIKRFGQPTTNFDNVKQLSNTSGGPIGSVQSDSSEIHTTVASAVVMPVDIVSNQSDLSGICLCDNTGQPVSNSGRDGIYINNPGSATQLNQSFSVLALGKSRIGDYILGNTIGKGNFAVVKLAEHHLLQTKVAVKIMNKNLIGSNNLEKVFREIEAMKRLEHSNIIKLYQVIETDSKIFMIMELAEKGEVFDHISHAHAFTEKDARELFWQVICAIHYCHKSGIVHRDLKAENLLLNADYKIKVADFGFCNFFETNKLLSTHCGSPQYAAPELFKGDLYDGPLADVWSLGVVLYIMVCGSFPFPGESLGDIRNQVLRGLVRFPFFLSTSCEYLVRGMLQIDPSKRFNIEQIISTPWMQASSNVEKYRNLMETFTKKAIELKFEEIFHRQHPEHSDLLREQMYHINKINLDPVLLQALQIIGYDEDDVRYSVVNKSFDGYYSVYYLLKDKINRFFIHPLLKVFTKNMHNQLVEMEQQPLNNPTTIYKEESPNAGSGDNKMVNYSTDSLLQQQIKLNKLKSPIDLAEILGKTNCIKPDSLNILVKLYHWIIDSDEEHLIQIAYCHERTDQLMSDDEIRSLNNSANVRRHTVQLTETPRNLKTGLADLANLSSGFPISSTARKNSPKSKPPKFQTTISEIISEESLDSTEQQQRPQQHTKPSNIPIITTTNSTGIQSSESVLSEHRDFYLHRTIQSQEISEYQYSNESSTKYSQQSESSITQQQYLQHQQQQHQQQHYQQEYQQFYESTHTNTSQDIVMGSNDSTNWSQMMHNLPQLNLPANIPALVHQPMAKFTIKDPHLLAPPDFMTPYNSCFPRRSSDGAADMQPLHRSNPGVGGSYPEQSTHRYRSSQNESLYEAVVKQIVPTTKENHLIGQISPLEFMGQHLKRFSLPINDMFSLQNLQKQQQQHQSPQHSSGIGPQKCHHYHQQQQQHLLNSVVNLRRGSEDSQISLWHRRVARSGYIDCRSELLASAPSSRGSSPYPRHQAGNTPNMNSQISSIHKQSDNPLCSCRRKPPIQSRYRSNDRLDNINIPINIKPNAMQMNTQESIDMCKKDSQKKSQISLQTTQNSAIIDSKIHGNESSIKSGLDLQELKSELQNLVSNSVSKDDTTNKTNQSSNMVIPSISLCPVTTNENQIDPFRDLTDNRPNNVCDNSHSILPNTEQDSAYFSNEEVTSYQRQMYFHWFPGFIRSSNVSASQQQIISNASNPDSTNYAPHLLAGSISNNKVQLTTQSHLDYSVEEIHQQQQQQIVPPPLPYYSPFIRDEDAADLAAIERVNRKLIHSDTEIASNRSFDQPYLVNLAATTTVTSNICSPSSPSNPSIQLCTGGLYNSRGRPNLSMTSTYHPGITPAGLDSCVSRSDDDGGCHGDDDDNNTDCNRLIQRIAASSTIGQLLDNKSTDLSKNDSMDCEIDLADFLIAQEQMDST